MEGPNHASQNIQPELPALTAAGEHPDHLDSRPCSPAGNELLPVSSTFATAEIPPDLLDYDETSSLHGDEHMQMIVQDHGYNSSASSAEQSGSDILARDLEDEKLVQGSSRSSSHSSVSSIPASVLVHSPAAHKTLVPTGTHQHHDHRLQRPPYWDDRENAAYEKTPSPFKSIDTIRRRDGAFRKPSSVRAMQMHTEDESDDQFLTPPRRRGGQRHSDTSLRSPGSSPLKRSPYYSPNGSASRQRVKKEYPLVLLHCTLLPPSLPVVGLTRAPNQKILKDVLPREYWRRWKLLEEKIGSGVLRDRGVLISHPEDTYDLLEERLLESLELQHPRLHHGHFLGQDANDSDKENDSSREDSATDDEQGEVCPDCGGRVIPRNNQGRKWEIKVFAANGLMRAGAWAAAWKEMEKVDVEVGLWLPRDVRRGLQKRLMEDESEHKLLLEPNEPVGEVNWGSHSPSAQEEAPGPLTEHSSTANDSSLSLALSPGSHGQEQVSSKINQNSAEDIDLRTLLINYIRVLASDRRNITIGILSIFVVFLAIGSVRVPASTSSSELQAFPEETIAFVPTSIVSMTQHQAASAATSNVLGSIPTFVADEVQISSAEKKGTASSQVSYFEIPTSSTELAPASMPTIAELQDPSADAEEADTTVPSTKSSEGFNQPGTGTQEASASFYQSEEPTVDLMQQKSGEASDMTRTDLEHRL